MASHVESVSVPAKFLPATDASAGHVCADVSPSLLQHWEIAGERGSNAASTALVSEESWQLQSQLALLIEYARKYPQAPALRWGGGEWSWSMLTATVEKLASGLLARCVRQDDIVALVADRTPLCIASMLAILRVGAAYLPLDATYPAARLTAMLEDAQPRLLIGVENTVAFAPAGLGRRTTAELLACNTDSPGAVNGGLAYVLFTSGSTGRPKGVAMTRRAVGALIDWHHGHPRLGQAARTLQFAPLGFDVSFQEIFSTLACGGTLILADEATRRDPHALLALVLRERVERLFLPYVALQAFAEVVATGGIAPKSLRDVITAGEALRITPSIRALFSALPGCVLHNHYGPTETHVVTAHELDGEPTLWPELPPIGRILPHVSARIVDENLHTVAPDSEGELLLGGDCLAAGYIHRPDLTDQRFIHCDGRRWYRSGDRVRMGCNDVFEYLGRCDDQIKLDGHRIEPGEIEAVLIRHPAVAEAVVVAVGDDGSKRIVANVLLREPHTRGEASMSELRNWCRNQLPPYMVPQRILARESLPLTLSGKIDRRKLARMAVAEPLPWLEGEPLIRQLSVLWCQLLDIDAIDPKANVFDLGARSLTVVRAAAELRRHGFGEITTTQLYECPSVAQLAAVLDGARESKRDIGDSVRSDRQRRALVRLAWHAKAQP